MENEQTRPLTMVIQDNKCCFGELLLHEEDETSFQANIKIVAGELTAGEVFTIILKPFDIFEQGLSSNCN